jgi:hypothetical protein
MLCFYPNSPNWKIQFMAHSVSQFTSGTLKSWYLHENRFITCIVCFMFFKNHYTKILAYLCFLFFNIFFSLYVSLIITSFLIRKTRRVKHHMHTKLDNSEILCMEYYVYCMWTGHLEKHYKIHICDLFCAYVSCNNFILFKIWTSNIHMFDIQRKTKSRSFPERVFISANISVVDVVWTTNCDMCLSV